MDSKGRNVGKAAGQHRNIDTGDGEVIPAYNLLPKEVFSKYGEAGLRYLDNRLLGCLNALQAIFGKDLIINTWHDNKNLNERTIRYPWMKTYAQFSDHSYGRAADFNIVGVTDEEVQNLIVNKWADDLTSKGMTGIEKNTPTWTHISVANYSGWLMEKRNGIYLIPGK